MNKHDTITSKGSNSNAVFDITKYVLSIMIVAIHSNLFPKILYPWLRLAVPLFFVISSYFLFTKLMKTEPSKKDSNVWHYVKRNGVLYLFWFVILLPVSLYLHHDIWIDDRNINCVLRFLRSLMFGSTFPASWYISATIISTLIVYHLSKKLDNKWLLLIGGLCYIFACLTSSYPYVIEQSEVLTNLTNCIETVIPTPCNSFMVGVLWVTCGKCIAENEIRIKNKIVIVMAVLSAILLEIEFIVHVKITDTLYNDLYFMLIPLTLFIFILISRVPKFSNNNGVTLRKLSTLYYCIHLTVLDILLFIFRNVIHFENSLLNFTITYLLITVISMIILKLEKKKYFSWLKYAY